MKSLRIASYILMGLGVILCLAGYFYRIQHWPDIFHCTVTGSVSVFIGALFFVVSLVKKS